MPLPWDSRNAVDAAGRKPSTGPATGPLQNFHAAYDEFVYEHQSVSKGDAFAEAVNEQLDRAQELGVEVTDPLQRTDPRAPGGLSGAEQGERWREFDKQMQDLKDRFPDKGFKTKSDMETEFKQRAEELSRRRADVVDRATGLGTVGGVTGTLAGGVTDPLVAMTLPFGATSSTSILRGAVIEAMIGAGVETAIQPQVMQWQANLDQEYTVGQAVTNIGLAGAGAGIGSAALRGTGRALQQVPKGGRKLVQRYRQLKKERPEVATADREDAEAFLQRYLDETERQPYDETPQADREFAETYGEARARAEADTGKPASVPAREAEPMGTSEFNRLDPDDIEVEPETFQFRRATGMSGTTDRLSGVETWDERLGGLSLVYRTEDGRMQIVDGHQRLDLAKRAKAAGQENVRMNVHVLEEGQGVTRGQARAIGAFKNIAEGSADAVDAAKILREVGERGLPSLPPRSALVRNARGLANLSEDAWRRTVAGDVRADFAARVGELVEDPESHDAVIRAVREADPQNLTQAESVIRQAGEAVETRTTETLFGPEEIRESLFKERARVLDQALKRVREDSRTWRNLVENAPDVEEAGNVLDRQANEARLTADQEILASIQRLAHRKGELADALTTAARSLNTGERKLRGAVDDFLQSVRRAADDGRLAGEQLRGGRRFDSDGAEPPPQSRAEGQIDRANEAAARVESWSENQQAANQALDAEVQSRFDESPRTEPGVGRPVRFEELTPGQQAAAESSLVAVQREVPFELLMTRAEAWQGELGRTANEIADELDGRVEVRNPGAKNAETARQRAAGKGKDPSESTDLVRLGLRVQSPEDADAAVARLSDRYELMDEGWRVLGSGYIDRPAKIRFSDGTVGEVQLWHPRMADLKEGRGTELYRQIRDLEEVREGRRVAIEGREAEYDQLVEESRRLYAEALQGMEESWLARFAARLDDDMIERIYGDSGTNASKSLRQASSETTEAPSRTSAPETEAQPSPSESRTQAERSSRTTAGRPSQRPKTLAESRSERESAIERPSDIVAVDDPENLRVPVGERVDETTGETVAETRTARDLMDEAEAEENLAREVADCL